MADDDSSSSSSDDEFLTLNDSSRDRESLVRKKLLESFYGRSAVAAARPTAVEEEEEEEDKDLNDDFLRNHADRDNLDSPAFDAKTHTTRQILHSNVHDLLEVEERLALQVRTLDSTMQTLVYENYSRFIDATDAIRSIGVNVQANETGLKKLSERIKSIDIASKDTEEALGSLRDQVAEKIRVKRLLSRLDALLKLPQTLREQIAAGKYRTATRSYISARSILSKHSEGFESLRNIETECTEILREMRKLLTRKLLHWNGRLEANDENFEESNLPEPPKTMTEIFECVGTLHILLEEETATLEAAGENQVSSTEELDKNEMQSLAMGAATRALDRILDAHMIQVQERRFAPLGDESVTPSLELRLASGGPDSGLEGSSLSQQPQGAAFVPRDYLDAILEVATLFGMSFGNVDMLVDFISEAFSSFLSHVRSILLDESAHLMEKEEEALSDDGILLEEGGTGIAGVPGASGEEEITSALTLLVQAVREMASGLSLPEVGVNSDYTSNLVNEAMKLSDSMVTRRVHQKFNDLRVNIVKDCLLPFGERLAKHGSKITNGVWDKENISLARQIASSTLSDCLQLVDDTIRSILAGISSDESDDTASSEMNTNLPKVVKQAVQDSIKDFTDWLAGAFEQLAGGVAGNSNAVVEVAPEESGGNEDEENEEGYATTDTSAYGANELSDIKDSENLVDLIESVRSILQGEESEDGTNGVHYAVAIAEMCRLAQNSVSENLDQSISTHIGSGKRKSRHMFADSDKHGSEDDEVSVRFRLAASRIFIMHASQKGDKMASCFNTHIENLREETVECIGPSPDAVSALSVVKALAIECGGIFDNPSRAGPVPELDEGPIGGLASSMGLNIKSSLQIDVERMFKEKIVVYPHPSEQLDFSRSSMVFLMMKIAFRACLESIRLCSLSASGYKQLQVDVEFIKLMIPHYINEDYTLHTNNACSSLSNMLSDVMQVAGERCLDESCENDEHLHQESISTLRFFMTGMDENDENGSRFIIPEESPQK